MWLLAQMLTFVTGNRRYFPTFEWSTTSWTHNIFRFCGMIFGEYYGIRRATTVGPWGEEGHTREARCAIAETKIRRFFRRLASVRVEVYQVAMATPLGQRLTFPYAFAIALDAATNGGSNTNNISVTCTGSNLVLIGMMIGDTGADPVPTMTYNSVSMTKIDSSQALADRWFYDWLLMAPSTGANTMTVASTTFKTIFAASYTGCAQSGQPDSHNAAAPVATTNSSIATTVVASNCWIVGAGYNYFTISAGSGTTMRGSQVDNAQMADSNAIVGTGSQSLTFNDTGPTNKSQLILSIAPFTSAAATQSLLQTLGIGV